MALNRRTLHLSAGLTLFVFVLGHLLNHGFGVVSLDAMNKARGFLIAPWTTAVGIWVLAVAALFHLLSALWVVYGRRTLRMPVWQASQLTLGLSIPLLVAEHAVGTGYARLAYDLEPNYEYVLATMWHFDPLKGWLQMALLCAAWGHACVGLHHWLKVKRWYQSWSIHFYAASLIIPSLAVMGFVAAGLRVQELAQDPAWLFQMIQDINFPGNEAAARLFDVRDGWIVAYIAAVSLVFVARAIRLRAQRPDEVVEILHKPTGQKVPVLPGATLLETLKAAGIQHASVCGGRARCSTCRVRIKNLKKEDCNSPTEEESAILFRLGLPPDVRLACQTRPQRSIECEPLLPPDVTISEALHSREFTAGHEVDVTVMFADLRGFTALSENKLPFDVVYLLNQYFESMGSAIEECGGTIDKFIGDGIMATFGDETSDDMGAHQALRAAQEMSRQLIDMNTRLQDELDEPLRLGIGLHAGPVIRGTMGFGSATQVTVIGDTVNTAARLEAATKEHGVQLIFSDPVRLLAGLAVDDLPTSVLTVRGRQEPLIIFRAESVADALQLSE